MKKQMIMGMTVLAVSLSFSIHAVAGATAGKSLKETMADYKEDMKKVIEKSLNQNNMSLEQAKAAREKIVAEVKMDEGKRDSLVSALSGNGDLAKQRLDSLATIIAVQKMVPGISAKNPAEGQSLNDASKAAAQLIADANLTGAARPQDVKTLNSLELSDTTAALKKLETLPEAFLIRFESTERDSYTQVLNKRAELVDSAKYASSEEAFVQAIMDVKKVSKDKAMEIVRKLKECV